MSGSKNSLWSKGLRVLCVNTFMHSSLGSKGFLFPKSHLLAHIGLMKEKCQNV